MGILTSFINTLNTGQTVTVERNLISIESIDPIVVEFGVAFEDLDLPSSIIGTFSSGSPSLVGLEWLEGDYESIYGTYTLYANIVLDGFVNDGDIQAEIEVGVLPEAIDPATLTPAIWIDAEDYAVGTFANGAAITNKGSNGATFAVVGTTLAIQVNADGKKEFVFDGASTIRCTSASSAFTNYKSGTTSYTALFLGKIGATADPDAIYGLWGNNAGTTASHGFHTYVENRVAQAATHGYQHAVTKGVGGSAPIAARWDNAIFNTRLSVYAQVDYSLIMHNARQFQQGNLAGLTDRTRTTGNTTSGLGTVVTYSGTAPTHAFEIGGLGNGVLKLVGKVEQFILFHSQLTIDQVRSIDSYYELYPPAVGPAFKQITVHQTLTNDYLLSGMYAVNADKSKINFITSKGPDHFEAGSDRQTVQSISTDNGFTFPALTTLFSDASNSPQGGGAGGVTPTGRIIYAYGKYATATLIYDGFIHIRYSDDDGATWSSEIDVPYPVTSPALTFANVCDKLEVCDNGDLIITWYGASGTSLYNVYVMKSTDNGLTWSHILLYTSGSVYKNEGTVVNLGGGNMLAMVRVEVAVSGSFKQQQYFSNDDGDTWSDQGQTDFGITMYVYAHPVLLRRFELDGTRVIAAYFVNRGSRLCHVVYCTAADLIANGLSAWSGKTVYTLDIKLYGAHLGWESGYPMVVHPDNDLKAEGHYSCETVNNDVCTINFFKINDLHKEKIKTELSIS